MESVNGDSRSARPQDKLWMPPDPLPPLPSRDESNGPEAESADHIGIPMHLISKEAAAVEGEITLEMAIRAVVNGWKDTVSEWSDVASDLTAQDSHGGTVLHYAAWFNKPEIIEVILGKGADVNSQVEKGTTALHLASLRGNVELVEVLLRHKADVSIAASCDWFAMQFATKGKHFAVMELLAKNGADPNVMIEGSLTPLHLACEKGKTSTVKVLLSYEADPNARTDTGITPLHLSCRWKHTEVVHLLLNNAKKAEPNVYESCNGITPLHLACETENVKTVGDLLKAGADPNVQNSCSGLTPLHQACRNGNVTIAEALLANAKANANANTRDAKDFQGFGPIHYAAEFNQVPVLELLLNQEANPSEPADNKDRSTPLHIACKNGKREAVEFLILRKADVNARDENNHTPLHYAAMEGFHQLLQPLTDAGADVNSVDNCKRSSLHLACMSEKDQLETIQGLVEQGAEVDARSDSEETPLFLASKGGHVAVVQYLLSVGADVAAKNDQNYTCIELAIEEEKRDVVLAVVTSNCWRTALRSCRKLNSKTETTPFRRMVEKMPDVAEVVMNRCIKTNSRKNVKAEKQVTPSHPEYRVTFNYEFLEDYKEPGQAQAKSSARYWGPKKFRKENHPLSIMVENKCASLLKHPLVTSLLSCKWRSYGRYLFFGNLFLYFLFLVFLTAFTLTVLTPLSDTCTRILNGTFNQSGCPGLSNVEYNFAYTAAVMIILFASLRLGLELLQLYKLRTQYVLEWVNWIEILLYICAIIFVWGFHESCFCVARWQWQVGVIAMLLAWLNLILFLQNWPVTGVYILMFITILITFIKIIFLPILLVIGFGLTFYMLFHDPTLELRTSFTNPFLAMIRIATMVTGELDFTSLFRQSGSDEEDIAFPAISFIVWIIFLVLMAILLSNLLVGLAVGDVNEIQEAARVRKIELQVDLLLHLDESSVISKLRYKLIPVEEEVELNKYSHLSFGTKLEVVVKGIWYYLWQHTPDFDPAKIEELANTYTPSLEIKGVVEHHTELLQKELQQHTQKLQRDIKQFSFERGVSQSSSFAQEQETAQTQMEQLQLQIQELVIGMHEIKEALKKLHGEIDAS